MSYASYCLCCVVTCTQSFSCRCVGMHAQSYTRSCMAKLQALHRHWSTERCRVPQVALREHCGSSPHIPFPWPSSPARMAAVLRLGAGDGFAPGGCGQPLAPRRLPLLPSCPMVAAGAPTWPRATAPEPAGEGKRRRESQ